MFRSIILALSLLSVTAQAQQSPCYWMGQLVKCFPTTGIYLNNSRTLRLGTNNQTNYVELKAPTGMGGNAVLTMPNATDTLVGKATTDTLTNKTLTAPVIATIVNSGTLTLPTSTDTLVGRATTDTLTNKTLTAPIIATISNTGTLTLPTSTDTLVGRATTDTLTNKTLTAPIIATISNTGTLTLPTSSDTLVGRDTTDTLTNKTLTSPIFSTIVNTGTLTLPTSTDTLVGRATTDTLTNKTLTSPTINTPVLNGFTDGSTPGAGVVGQLISTISASETSLTTAQYADAISGGTALTAGTWDIQGIVRFTTATTTSETREDIGISTTSGNSATGLDDSNTVTRQNAALVLGNVSNSFLTPVYRVNISGSTTYYIKCYAEFSVSTMTCRGTFRATRIR